MIPIRNLQRFAGKAIRQPGYAARVLIKRGQAAWYRRFGCGRSSMPEALTLFLTHRCNLRCRMCGQWGDQGVTRKQPAGQLYQELSKEQLLQFIGEVSAFRPNITLFGGEPLLHAHCLEVIRAVKQAGMHCLMITNGSLLAEKAEELVRSGLDELNVSIDGHQELHDYIRGTPGVWSRIMGGLEQVNAAKKRFRRIRPLVNLQCTISQFNYRDLDSMPEVAARAQADSLTFHHLIFLEKEAVRAQKAFDHLLHCSSEQWEGFLSDPKIDVSVLSAQIEQVRAQQPPACRIDFYPRFNGGELKQYYSGGLRRQPGACVSPWVVAYIFPDGEVRPCLNFSYSFGNIQDKLFPEIWNGSQALSYRRLLQKQGVFPVCKRCTELFRY